MPAEETELSTTKKPEAISAFDDLLDLQNVASRSKESVFERGIEGTSYQKIETNERNPSQRTTRRSMRV